MSATRSDLLPRLAAILWILLVSWIAIRVSAPHGVTPESAPATEFSAERAMRHVREIARAPHPVGSADHARVRDYLLAQLTALSLEPTIQKSVGTLPEYGVAATVENILARKHGSDPGPAVLLAAHYDSVPAGPGAGDDGAGVAALLEAVRALSSGPVPRHDVIILISDGEELGLLGAAAFVAEHPWKNDVGVVLNFDNRGTRGAVLMYETSEGNLALMRELAAAVPQPRATSLAASIARLLPNSSDFYVFRKAGLAGLNFAFIGAPENYHTPQDTPENLDLRTLQQAGDYALPLARRLADEDLSGFSRSNDADAIFFNLLGNWLVIYPRSWARPLGFLVLALFLAVAVIGVRRGAVRLSRGLLAVLLCIINLLVAWRAATWLAAFLPRFHQAPGRAGPYLFHPLYAAALYCFAAAITFAIWELVRFHWEEIALAGASVWTAAGLALAYRIPEASYLCVWGVVPLLVVLGILFTISAGNPGPRSATQLALICLGILPAALTVIPLLPSVHLALGISELGAAGLAIVVTLAAWLFAAAIAPAAAESAAPVGRVSVLSLAAGAAVLALALGTVRYNDRAPRPESMLYVADLDTSKTLWMSSSDQSPVQDGVSRVDPWRRQYLTASPATMNLPVPLPFQRNVMCWAHEAPSLDLPAPTAELLSDAAVAGARQLRILLHARSGAARLTLQVEAEKILAVSVEGRTMPGRRPSNSSPSADARGAPDRPQDRREVWTSLYAAPPAEGLELDLSIPPGATAQLTVAALSDGLPTVPGQSFWPRPPSVTLRQWADMTIVKKSFTF